MGNGGSVSEDVFSEAEALILRVLDAHPEIPVEKPPGSLGVDADGESGFPVLLHGQGDRVTVYYDLWHEHFDQPMHAAACFLSGLASATRLRLKLAGRTPYRATLETRVEGAWGHAGTVGAIFFPFWRRRGAELRQNGWIVTEDLVQWLEEVLPEGFEPEAEGRASRAGGAE